MVGGNLVTGRDRGPGPGSDSDPGSADEVCKRLIPRALGCIHETGEASPTGEEMVEAFDECRDELGDLDGDRLRRVVACEDTAGCDAFLECVTGVVDGDDGTPDVPVISGTPAPELIERLPPAQRAYCAEMANRYGACIGAIIRATGVELDEQTMAAVEAMRPQVAQAMSDACLQSAVAGPEAFAYMERMRSCLQRPCDQLFDCMTQSVTSTPPVNPGSADSELVDGPIGVAGGIE